MHAKVAVSIHRGSGRRRRGPGSTGGCAGGCGSGSPTATTRSPSRPRSVVLARPRDLPAHHAAVDRVLGHGRGADRPPTLSIFHPTGFPTYTMLGWLWSQLPIGEVAWRMNLLSAVSRRPRLGVRRPDQRTPHRRAGSRTARDRRRHRRRRLRLRLRAMGERDARRRARHQHPVGHRGPVAAAHLAGGRARRLAEGRRLAGRRRAGVRPGARRPSHHRPVRVRDRAPGSSWSTAASGADGGSSRSAPRSSRSASAPSATSGCAPSPIRSRPSSTRARTPGSASATSSCRAVRLPLPRLPRPARRHRREVGGR